MGLSSFTHTIISLSKLKVTPPKQGYRPDVTSPVLIKNLLKTGLPHPKIHIQKVDISKKLTLITIDHHIVSCMIIYVISVLYIVDQYNATPKKESSFQFLPESSPFGQQGKVIINSSMDG